jgi:hypothetical protein
MRQARRYMRDILDPHQLISEKNRESFKHGQFDKGLRRRVDFEITGLHLSSRTIARVVRREETKPEIAKAKRKIDT